MTAGALLVLGLLAAAAGGAMYRLAAQSRAIEARLAALERASVAELFPGEPMSLRKFRLFRRFHVNNSFEADNILPSVAHRDEYGLGDEPLAEDDVVVDVGAHVGTFSFLCYVLGSRAIYAYEPWPANFQALRRNLASLSGTHLFPVAVWRSDDPAPAARLVLSGPDGENTGACSALTGGGPLPFTGGAGGTSRPAASQSVESVPLDGILRRFERVRLLKLDCEGSEFPILLTSRELDRVERILAEVHEVDEAQMALLAPASRVSGYAAFRVEHLVVRLRERGFEVRTRTTTAGMHLIDARRRRGPGPGP